MNEPYASAVGTTVLKLDEIPERPPEFDGALAIFKPKEDVDMPKICLALEAMGSIVSVEHTPGMPQTWIVRFETHDQAL